MNALYLELAERLARLEATNDELAGKVSTLESRNAELNEQVARLDNRAGFLNGRVEGLENRVATLAAKLAQGQAEIPLEQFSRQRFGQIAHQLGVPAEFLIAGCKQTP